VSRGISANSLERQVVKEHLRDRLGDRHGLGVGRAGDEVGHREPGGAPGPPLIVVVISLGCCGAAGVCWAAAPAGAQP
jgi:hypothetical protein